MLAYVAVRPACRPGLGFAGGCCGRAGCACDARGGAARARRAGREAGVNPYAEATWWQRLPDCLAEGGDAVLVTVARVAGSAPRDVGAAMLVETGCCADTLGGGNLEFEAIATARALLAGASIAAVQSYALGAVLRQCCGGAVTLLDERIDAAAATAQAWAERRRILQEGGRLLRHWSAAGAGSEWRGLAGSESCINVALAGHDSDWQQVVGEHGLVVRLFGAGHVGRALARVLTMSEARLQWIDTRPPVAAAAADLGLPVRLLDDALNAVADAPPDCWFVVMTHSHTRIVGLTHSLRIRQRLAQGGDSRGLHECVGRDEEILVHLLERPDHLGRHDDEAEPPARHGERLREAVEHHRPVGKLQDGVLTPFVDQAMIEESKESARGRECEFAADFLPPIHIGSRGDRISPRHSAGICRSGWR